MPQSVDVGSVLGGRYRVTAQVLTSVEQDLVLEGLDQILNRSVSILVAGPDNAERVRTSAREIATGERPGTMHILDLGAAEGETYLVTSKCPAADLLDLIVAENPPYIEPFFTDTLGSELFGYARPMEPDERTSGPADGNFETVQYPAPRAPSPGRRPLPPPPSAAPAISAAAADAASVTRAPADTGDTGTTADTSAPRTAAQPAAGAAGEPSDAKVTLWSDDDYGFINEDHAATARPGRSTAAATGGGESLRAAANFPSSARDADNGEDDLEDNDATNDPKPTRWLAIGILALVLIGAVVFAFNQLGSGFSPIAAGSGQHSSAPSKSPAPSKGPAPADAKPAPDTAKPVAASVVRLVPDSPDLDAGNDDKLSRTIDGNPASFWASLQYANNQFGGYADNMALVVKLKDKATITRVNITQLKGSGGSFEIMLNDEPTLDGAKQVAQGSFTGPNVALSVPASNGKAPTARYVIINFTQLPTLSNTPGPYPYGIQLAEIEIS